jgi:ABC-type multidrug transport system fused ATPase/permease subunit
LIVLSSFEAVLPLPQAFQYLENSQEAGRRLFEVVDAQPAVVDPVPVLAAPQSFGLRARDLSFSYEPGGPPVLHGVNFDLPQNGKIAIVGPSGAGKSTLLQLLLRFWDYEQGSIKLAGQELRSYSQADVRRLVAFVTQRPHLFSATIRDNLSLADPNLSQASLVQATRQAQLHDFVETLPQGYDTWIGEQGLALSGGQRQRLAIARAIVQDAPILIMDEPSANLDALTEQRLMAELHALMANRTSLLVTHRLVGLESVDQILVLKAGRIVERGSHSDLIQMGGEYRQMWDLQQQSLILA